jgi:two-component system NtrC family sensor kinase
MTAQQTTEAKSTAGAITHARRLLFFLGFLLCASTLTSLYFDLRGIGEKYRTLASELSRSFFQAIDLMRDWNLNHGGFYVLEGKDSQPNPYLAESLRTAVTTDGRILTMINHAQMTRLFSELLTQERGIQMHISSLTPIRPDNRPDAWERSALIRFQKGGTEEFDIVGKGAGSVFKYMAPLRVDDRCLACHPKREDSPEHVRGGISVFFSYAPFLQAISVERRQNLLVHSMFFTIGVALLALLGAKMLRSIGALEDAMLRVKRLEGLLPICAQCKKIRLVGANGRDQSSWIAIEKYIQDRTDAEFTHGLCPQCAKDLYPGYFRESTK